MYGSPFSVRLFRSSVIFAFAPLLTKNGFLWALAFHLWKKEEVAGSRIRQITGGKHARWCVLWINTALQTKHYEMVHCLDAKSTHFSTIPTISFSLVHAISRAWPLRTRSAIQHWGYWGKNQMVLNFKCLIQPFFALGEFGNFQYTECFVLFPRHIQISKSRRK
jgi:hypothetical protein